MLRFDRLLKLVLRFDSLFKIAVLLSGALYLVSFFSIIKFDWTLSCYASAVKYQ